MILYHLYFYVPADSAEAVKEALFDKGAGVVGDYLRCAWQTEGRGQFYPVAGANPTIGETGKLETVNELKVEMVCTENRVHDVIDELKRVHPYEEPAYGAWKLESF
jgi:structural toxin protein (hemagglutinin/hemolysin) RtxA